MDPIIKKIINNGTLIKRLAPMLDSQEAAALADVAQLYSDLLDDFGIKPSFDGFDGCDEAKMLVKWISSNSNGNAEAMREWTATIWSAIADLVAGKLPT